MKVRFDENDDIVVNDIPDEMMAEIERRANQKSWSPEDELRDIFIRAVSEDNFAAN